MNNSPTTNTSKYWDVFISYRREGGSPIASLLQRELSRADEYTVFLDTSSLESGKFGEAISNAINTSSNFIAIITPGALRRCFENSEEDFVLKEYKQALAKLEALETQQSKTFAKTNFKIIPIFAGEDLRNYAEYEQSNPEVWRIINSIFGDDGHHGVDFSDSSKFTQQLNHFRHVMLLNPARKFAEKLVAQCVDDDEPRKEDLAELLLSYLKMYPEQDESSEASIHRDYLNARDKISLLLNERLQDIIGEADSRQMYSAFKGFRLSHIKGAIKNSEIYSGQVHAFVGSRQRVVENLKDLLLRRDSRDVAAAAAHTEVLLDRLDIVADIFSKAMTRILKRDLLKIVSIAVKQRIADRDSEFANFLPVNWKSIRPLVKEMLERMTYMEMCEFIYGIQYSLGSGKRRYLLMDKNDKKRLQEEVWEKITAKYVNFESRARIRSDAKIERHINRIESFLAYGTSFEFCDHDFEAAEEENEFNESDNTQSDESSPTDKLYASLSSMMRGKSRDYKALIKNYLEDREQTISSNRLNELLISALAIDQGELLSTLSMPGVSMDLKFRSQDWRSVCIDLGIKSNGRTDELIQRIRVTCYGDLGAAIASDKPESSESVAISVEGPEPV